MRPCDRRCTDSADEAVTAAWRVTGFVTDVASPRFSVAFAPSARQMYGSPDRFCESTTSIPSQPAASARRAKSALRFGAATVAVQNSITDSLAGESSVYGRRGLGPIHSQASPQLNCRK